MASGGFLNFIQYWLNISAINQQIYLSNMFVNFLTPMASLCPYYKAMVEISSGTPSVYHKCFALELRESKAKHGRNVLGCFLGRKN